MGSKFLFFVLCLSGMTILRKLGWSLSKSILYTITWPICLCVLLSWGAGIALGLRYMILWLHPGWILKTFGYGAAAYASVANYGLFAQETIPDSAELRHIAVSQTSMLTFIGCSIVFAFTMK